MISLRDALRVMATGVPFSGTYIKCNLTKQTGGQKVEFQNATLAGGSFGKKESPRNANHFVNGTRNIMVPGNPRPVKIHNLLLIELNGERVYLG